MIPVQLAPEPENFDALVRNKGHHWLRKNGISLDVAPAKGTIIQPYWHECNKELWSAYSGVCAYLAIYFEFVTGAASTDHFVAKSKHAGKAYDWDNYRLSCLGANRNKNKYDDVLDPVGLRAETFYINFADGSIFPNPTLSPNKKTLALQTIKRLMLDSQNMRKMRTEHYSEYMNNECTLPYLQRKSPFVWYEIVRQGLQ